MTPSRPLRRAYALAALLLVGLGCAAPPPTATPAPPTSTPASDPGVAPPPTSVTPTAAAQPPQPPAGTATQVPISRAVASPTPVPEHHLRLPITEPPTLDPGLATDNASLDVIAQLFEGLVAFDARGNPVGIGAESWDVSEDGLTYTFKLRDGPRWSDGKPVTAQDYAWAWRRNISPSTASDYATTLYPIKNATRIHRQGLDPSELGVEVPDDRTLAVTLEQPAGYFLRLVSTWTMLPQRQDVIARSGDRWTEARNIVTNGPFLLKEWQHDGRLVLEVNPDYWGDKPRLTRATFRIFPEGADDQVLAAYEAGELDTLGPGTSFEVPAGQIERLQADPTLRQQLKIFPQSATMFITVNHRRPHFKDRRVRIALGQAIERDRLLQGVLKRAGSPAAGLQPEGVVGRQPELWPKESIQEARKNLAEAGFPEGKGFPEITFTYNASPQWKLLAEYLQQRYKDALGIALKPEPMDWAAFMRWRRSDDWPNTGDLYRGGWFADYEDPNNWYNVLWDSREDRVVFNSGWKHDEYDQVVRRARAEADPSIREELYRQAEQILADEYPNIPIFHYSVRTLVKPYVLNFEPERVLGVISLRKVALGDRR